MILRLPVRIYFCCILFCSAFTLQAQTQHHFSGWGALFGSAKLNPKFSLHFDAQLRSLNEWAGAQSFIIRPGLHYQLPRNMLATVGYAYIGHYRNLSGISGWAPEHRSWEQFIINQSFPVKGRAGSLQHRFRLEQRFIDQSMVAGNKLVSNGYQFAQRLRYFARAVVPLQPAKTFQQGIFVSLQNEVFVNIGDAAATNGKFFDQNRAYASLGYRLNAGFDIEAGYMQQFVAGKTNNTVNSIVQLAGYLRL